MKRRQLALGASVLLATAAWRLLGGQAAVSWSLPVPGHEDLTFWVNHDGLEQLDFEGEVGFGDLARVLMRRRANSAKMMTLRNRFVFKSREFPSLDTPDLLRGGARYVVPAGRAFAIPAVVEGKGRLYRVTEPSPGVFERTVGGHRVTLDVRPLARLRVEPRDERGRPVAARIYLTGADGLGYAPKGTVSRFASEPAEQFFHAREDFEIDLPAGETVVEAARGPEYGIARQTVELKAGSPARVTLKIARWTDMARAGWYSSDAHIHANYTADHHQVVTQQDVLTYALAEDLHIPNMMVANSSGAFVHDRAWFEGKLNALSRPPYLLYWNEEMRNAGGYGHMCLYGLKKLVEPVYTGFRNTPHSDDYPPNYTQAKATQEQGGAVTYAHPGYAPDFEGASMKEMPVDAALGVIDAMDVMSNNPEEVALEMWYRLLNCGVRVGISAGTDSFTNVQDHYVPGGHRVYAKVDGPLTYGKWIESYKRGRTFASNGPILDLKVNGRGPGDEIRLGKGRHELKVSVKATSQFPVGPAEVVVNGRVVEAANGVVAIETGSWIAARVKGPWNRLILNDGYAFAHTSPVWVTVGGKGPKSPGDAKDWVDWIGKLIQRTSERGRFSDDGKKREVLALFERGREIYRKQAE
jgi:hypothetical protein